MSIHTAPEHDRYAAIDAFTCSTADPNIAIDYLVEVLNPKEVNRQTIIRGVR